MAHVEFESLKAEFIRSFWPSFVKSTVIGWAIVGVAVTLIHVFNC